MVWSEAIGKLYLGCEYEPVVQTYDPNSNTFERSDHDVAIGDVAAMVLDADGGRIFTTSFWNAQVVAELDLETMSVRRTCDIGGGNVDLAFDPSSGRLFATGYYDSRVRVISAQGLEKQDDVVTGFGTRAVAVDSSRDLLLVSSVYDGVLRVCEASTGKGVASLRVGGHVKDIVIDSERGLAWFWSQCGLFRLDLEQLR